ncbi:MAG TPA: flagellar hook-length control protein FliK, partial [Mariprofundaceae bacterium]|nr:flagellar hook-length control protein FliK [Mariprofundaceae bacterium]
QVDRNTHPKALQPEAVSHNDSNHNSAIAGGQAQAGRTTLPGGVQAQVMPGHAGDGGSAGATTHSGSPDGGGAGAAGTQSQNGSGNVPFTAHGANTTVASALPKAYAAGAPPAPHTGPWTVMQAMQEVGHQASQGRTRIELKLEPAHLGKIQVFLGSDSKKHIQVHMVVDQAASRQVIAQHLPSLRQTLEQQGLNLGHFSMGSQHQQGGEGAGQQQPGQQHQFADASPDRHGGMDALTPSSIPVSTTMQVTAPGGDSRLSIHI